MKKATKGALAAVAAGTLLVGGAGSLAYWTGSSPISGATTINSGKLSLSAVTCTGTGLHDWQYASDSSVFTPATSKVVPGDKISKVCSTTLTMAGDHIAADLSLNTPASFAAANGLTAELVPSADFVVDGATQTHVGGAGTYTVKVTVTVDFPRGAVANNGSQDLSASLNALTVSATQA